MARVVDVDTFWTGSQGAGIRVWGPDAQDVDITGGSRASAALTALIAGQHPASAIS